MNSALGADPEAWGIIVDSRRRPIRWTDRRHLAGVGSLRDVGVPMGELVSTQSTLQDALEALLSEGNATATVTGNRGEYVGTVTIDVLIDTIKSLRSQHANDHDEPREAAGTPS